MNENIKNFTNAGFAGIISRTATAPLERLKVLYQNEKNIKVSYNTYLYKLIKNVGIMSLFNGKKVNRNPWSSTTVEWSAPSPPLPHVNFEAPLEVYRGPYEYSVPGESSDFSPQTQN